MQTTTEKIEQIAAIAEAYEGNGRFTAEQIHHDFEENFSDDISLAEVEAILDLLAAIPRGSIYSRVTA